MPVFCLINIKVIVFDSIFTCLNIILLTLDCILSLYFHRCREVIRDLRGLTEDSHFTDEAREAK